MKTLKKIWDNLEPTLVVFFFFCILIVIFIQIFMRLVFNDPPIFTEELARFLYLWMVFIGFSWVTKTDTNLCIDIVKQKIYGRRRAWFNLIVDFVTVGTFAFLFYHSIDYVKFSMYNPAPAMRFPMGYVYLVMPIACVLTVIRSIERIVMHIKRLRAGDQFEEYSKIASEKEVDLLAVNPEEGKEEKK